MGWTKANLRAYEASKTLKPITRSQRLYGEKHIGSVAVKRYKKLYCSDCGSLLDNIPLEITVLNDCKCGNCGAKINEIVTGTARKSIYYDIVTTHKGLQVIRHFVCEKISKAGQPAKYFTFEAAQNWIDEIERNRNKDSQCSIILQLEKAVEVKYDEIIDEDFCMAYFTER